MTQLREQASQRLDALVEVPPAPTMRATPASWVRPGRTLLVASTGGHLEQLYRLRQRFMPYLEEVEWATFDTGQARHLLADEIVHFVPFAKPRDGRGAFLDGIEASRLLRRDRFARVVSTGAAVAVPFLGIARRHGLAAHYIESAARSDGFSLSGRMVAKVPGVRLYGQYPAWTAGRVQFRGSVFDGFTQGELAEGRPLEKVVVSFGTQRDFGFRRALDSLVRLLPQVCAPGVEILWQTGATDTTGLPIVAVDSVPRNDMEQAVAEADLVISHAGVGTALMTLEHGKCPVLLPRRSDLREHADDHQRLIAEELGRRGLAIWADPNILVAGDLHLAARMRAERVHTPPPFILQPD